MTLILGIDPGRTGALAVLDTAELRVTTHDMPDTLAGLHALFLALPVVKFAVIERPFYPPKIGVLTITKIAEALGELRSTLAWRDIPTFDVKPNVWKAALGVPADKAAARRRAGEFAPADAEQWRLAKHHGRAEAALIAWYGRRWE